MNYKIFILSFCALLTSCKNIKNTKKDIESKYNIEVIISRGGIAIPVEDTSKYNFSVDSISDKLYIFNLDTMGCLDVFIGVGYWDGNDNTLHVKDTLSVHSSIINKAELGTINRSANEIYKSHKVYERDRINDLWVANLRLNNKIKYIYFVGQEEYENNTLPSSFNKLIDELVRLSPVEIKDYDLR